MNRITTLVGAAVTSVVLVSTMTSTAFAWHPVGSISKQVQNVSQGSQLVEADTPSAAIHAKAGDTLKYVITVKNSGKAHSRGWNDMHYTKVTDQLPAGLTLAEGQANKSLGHIEAGKTKSFEFTVTVNENSKATVICNTAKFTGDSEVYDQPQKGQDDACIKVAAPVIPAEPETPELPEEPETPTTPELPEQPEAPAEEPVEETPAPVPTELPKTGISATVNVAGVAAITAAAVAFLRSRR